MSTTFTLNPGGNTTFSNPLREIAVTTGTITVHQGTDGPTAVSAGEVYDAHNAAPTDVYSPDGANYAVTHSDEPVPAATVADEPVEGAVNATKKRATK